MLLCLSLVNVAVVSVVCRFGFLFRAFIVHNADVL